jgi:polyhydroxybutyrate depolymerase
LWAQLISSSFQHNGITRTYKLYIPANYATAQPCPIVLNLHGYGSNANEQIVLSQMNNIADTAGFIVAYPEGLPDNSGQRIWNSGYGLATDDVGFINALLDSITSDYSVQPQRTYSTGMSNGGFMSNTLACEINGRLAAIASVTGTMSWAQWNTCQAVAEMPFMHIHGTSDAVVPYGGNTLFLSVDLLVNHWRNRNGLTTANTNTAYPNIVATDGSNAELFVYETGGASPVHLIRVNNGGHSWPGSGIFVSGNTNMDVQASVEIWQFFQRFSSSYTTTTKTQPSASSISHWKVLGQGRQLEWRQNQDSQVQIYNAMGQVLWQQRVIGEGGQQQELPLLPKGIYWVRYQQQGQAVQTYSFIKP